MKRALDILVSLTGLVLLSPLFVIITFIVKADSRGPVFYRQVRVGKDGVDFRLFKFRSMKINSDKGSQLTIGAKDSRITRSGYFLRKYKLDEFPQLLNVLKGEMSLVGPRPELRKYVEMYTAEQMKVLEAKPGITDLASIKYRDENELLVNLANPEEYYIKVIMPDKIKLNLEYISQRTFAGDLKIIFKTLGVMTRNSETSKI